MAYTNNFETLVEKEVVIDIETTVKMKLDKNKKNDNLKLHIREYATSPDYTGYTKNGISIPVESIDQLDSLQRTFNEFIESIGKHL